MISTSIRINRSTLDRLTDRKGVRSCDKTLNDLMDIEDRILIENENN